MTAFHATASTAAASDVPSSPRTPPISISRMQRTRMCASDSGAVYDGAPVRVCFSSHCHSLRANRSSDVARYVRVRVEFSDRAPCDPSTRVELNGGRNFTLVESLVNSECVAEFFDVPTGEYRVTISGADARNGDQGEIEVHRGVSQDVEVRAVHTEKSGPSYWAPAAAFISVRDLGMPPKAARE